MNSRLRKNTYIILVILSLFITLNYVIGFPMYPMYYLMADSVESSEYIVCTSEAACIVTVGDTFVFPFDRSITVNDYRILKQTSVGFVPYHHAELIFDPSYVSFAEDHVWLYDRNTNSLQRYPMYTANQVGSTILILERKHMFTDDIRKSEIFLHIQSSVN